MTVKTSNPRHVVQSADMADLLTAYASGSRHPFALTFVDGETRVVCPSCSYVDHNGGSASVIDQWRWSCDRCRRTGTRYQLERIVLENAEMLEALYEQVQQ
jgi:transposase-like protein